MNQVKITKIIQKSTRPSNKKGYIEVKFRTRFKNPLNNKRREVLSDWYVLPEKYNEGNKVKVSPQVHALILKDLQAKATQTFESITKESLTSNSDVLFFQVWEEWHNERVSRKLVGPKTIAGETGRYWNHIIKYIPQDTILKNITANIIKGMLDDYYPIGNHKRLAHSIKSDMSSVYKFAITRNYLTPDKNPIPFIKIDNKGLEEQLRELGNNRIEDQYLEPEELKEVLGIVRENNEQYARILEFQVLTGMRIGEVLGLKEEEIDFKNKIASVVRTRATHAGANLENYEGNVKNLQSYRRVSLSDRAIEILKEEMSLNHQHIQFNPDYKDSGWIFTSKSKFKPKFNGQPLHYGVINNFLNSPENGKPNKKGGKRSAGIDIDNKISFNKHITTHIFRHTHISYLAEQGVPLEAIQERVGHNRGSRVTEIYLHVTKKMKNTITPIIDNIVL